MKILFNSLLVVFLVFGISFAQNRTNKKGPHHRFGIYGGVILAQDEFASTNGSKAGFANNGVGVMFEFELLTKLPVDWISSVSLTDQSFKSGALQDQRPDYGVTADNYVTTWIMTGISRSKSFGPEISLYGLAQIGFLISKYPDIYYATSETELKESSELGKALAYAAGVGFTYNFLNFGVRYYASFPKYEQTSPFRNNGASTTRDLPVKILQVVFGINF